MQLNRALIKFFCIPFLCALILTAVGSSATFASAMRQQATPIAQCPVLSIGSNGNAVKVLQSKLKKAGKDLGRFGPDKDGIDGIFGSKTRAAVISFQRDKKLKVDGIVGKQTWTALGGCDAPTGSSAPARPDPTQINDVRAGCSSGNGACGSATFKFTGRNQITNVNLWVQDTKCDAHQVYIELRIYRPNLNPIDVLKHSNTGGCGASKLSWNNLSYTTGTIRHVQTQIIINGVRVRTCVEDWGPNTCYQSNYIDNPNV